MKTDIIKKNLVEFLLIGSLPFLGSCNKSFDNLSSKNTNVLNMDVSPTFKFRTTKLVKLEIAALDNVGGAVPGIRFDVYTSNPDKGGLLIMSGVTDKNGILATELKLPADADSLSVGTKSIGFLTLQEIPIEAGTAGCVFGGKLVNSGLKGQEVKTAMSLGKGTTVFQPLGPYTTLGVPTELVKPDDIIDVSFLTDLNNLLPEKISLPSTHPQYFFDSNQSDIILNSASDLWMTFVSEGSGTSNTLAFYKFREGKPPVLATDIDTLFIVFPNIRFSGHNGGLVSGNKVFLGSFPKGTGIGFAMITNGWNGKSLSKGINTFYTDKMLNPEKDVALRNHAVLLNDSGRGRYLLSFEEKIRNSGGGADDDFNDAIFYVTANPVKAVNPENVIVTEYATHDADNDGITDVFDDYPKDPEKAFNNYYPSKGSVGTLAFEDSWPESGDYDLNDMVLDYNFNRITNANNMVVSVEASVIVKALGANYHSGFGLQLPVGPEYISGVKGNDVRRSLSGENPNGTEAGQSKATVLFFDDAFNELPYPGGKIIGVNTTMDAEYVTPDTMVVTIDLTKPLNMSDLGVPPYNSFIMIGGDRSREEHLIDNSPTDLADPSLFTTGADDSKPGSGRYYVTAQNLPFAIDIAGPFDYPVEKVSITKAHLKFFEWAQSGGTLYLDWYKTAAGYRDDQNIYTH